MAKMTVTVLSCDLCPHTETVVENAAVESPTRTDFEYLFVDGKEKFCCASCAGAIRLGRQSGETGE